MLLFESTLTLFFLPPGMVAGKALEPSRQRLPRFLERHQKVSNQMQQAHQCHSGEEPLCQGLHWPRQVGGGAKASAGQGRWVLMGLGGHQLRL